MLLSVVVAARRSAPLLQGVWPAVVRLAALAVIIGAAWLDRPNSWGQIAYHDIAAIGWVLLLASTVSGSPDQTWSRALSRRSLAWVGLISYSVYIWHEPTLLLLNHLGITSREPSALPWTIAVVLVTSLGVGFLSYWALEYPTSKLRSLRDRSGQARDYYPELSRSGS
jgi:peptidoglycan/LPS O-acetylase OafA/YrhL